MITKSPTLYDQKETNRYRSYLNSRSLQYASYRIKVHKFFSLASDR